jgi:hypothetical protein
MKHGVIEQSAKSTTLDCGLGMIIIRKPKRLQSARPVQSNNNAWSSLWSTTSVACGDRHQNEHDAE